MTVVAAVVAPDGAVVMASDRRTTMMDGTVCWPAAAPKVQRHRVALPGSQAHDVLLAPVGSSSVASLARWRLEWPRLPALPKALTAGGRYVERNGGSRAFTDEERADAAALRDDALERWAFDVAAALTELADRRDGTESAAEPFDQALLAYDGRLWGLGPWQTLRMTRGYEATGSGACVATGALAVLHATGRLAADPVDAVRMAVEVAIDQDAGCGGPVDIEVLPPQRR